MSERVQNKNLTPFKPGQSGNPHGRPRGLRTDLKGYKSISATDAGKLIQKMLDMTPTELMAVMENPDMPAYEVMIASVVRSAVLTGDHSKFDFLLNRTVGKVKDDKTITLKPVTYRTSITADGSLLQDIVDEDQVDSANEQEED